MELNLLPNVARFQLEKMTFTRQVSKILIIVMGVWVGLLGCLMVFYWVNKLGVSKAEATHKQLTSEYMQLSENVLVNQALRYKLKLASEILEERFEYGKTFRKINGLFSSDVKITSMKMKTEKTYELTGEVNNGEALDVVERKIVDINSGLLEGFGLASIGTISNNGDNWGFKLDISLI